MNSEKVKEIKKALKICTQQGNSYCHEEKTYEQCPYYEDCKKAIHENNPQSLIMEHTLTLINELESENIQMQKLIDAYREENERLYGDIHKKGMKGLEEQNEKNLILIGNQKDRIAELENLCNKTYEDLTKEIDRLRKENLRIANRITCQAVIPDDKLEKIKKECFKKIELAKCELLKQFAERLKDMPFNIEFTFKESSYEDVKKLANLMIEYSIKYIDETLKEFIGEE